MAHAAPDALKWKEVATEASQRPDLPRSGHCSATLPAEHDAEVIIFGGYTETPDKQRQVCNDTWVFGDGAWRKLETTGGPPRMRLAGQAIRIGWQLYLIGGWDPGMKQDGGEVLNDVWTLDLKTAEWQERHVEGEALQPISRFQAVPIGDDIYIHTHRNTNDILRLSTSSDTLRLTSVPISTPDGAPSSRGLHSMIAVGSSLYVFGGAPKKGPMLDDVWRLDLAGERPTWQQLDPAGPKPGPRCSHTAVAAGSDIIFHGGAVFRDGGGMGSSGGGLKPLGDTFVLDTEANVWRWPETSEGSQPLPRNAATMNCVGDQLVFYGGWQAFVETYNDTWLLQL